MKPIRYIPPKEFHEYFKEKKEEWGIPYTQVISRALRKDMEFQQQLRAMRKEEQL